ncbi:MAG: hypothetical protein ACK56I_14635, partial [bacterium]
MRSSLVLVGVREGVREQRHVVVQHADGIERTLEPGSGGPNYPADIFWTEAVGSLLQHQGQLASQTPPAAGRPALAGLACWCSGSRDVDYV